MNTTIRTLILAASLCLASTSALATDLVVIVNLNNPATHMFKEQAAQFFLGKSSLFTPVEYRDGLPIRNEFNQKVLGKDGAQVKAIWSQLVFTGKGMPPKEYGSSAEVKKAVAGDVRAIAYIEKAALDDTVKAILTVP